MIIDSLYILHINILCKMYLIHSDTMKLYDVSLCYESHENIYFMDG